MALFGPSTTRIFLRQQPSSPHRLLSMTVHADWFSGAARLRFRPKVGTGKELYARRVI